MAKPKITRTVASAWGYYGGHLYEGRATLYGDRSEADAIADAYNALEATMDRYGHNLGTLEDTTESGSEQRQVIAGKKGRAGYEVSRLQKKWIQVKGYTTKAGIKKRGHRRKANVRISYTVPPSVAEDVDKIVGGRHKITREEKRTRGTPVRVTEHEFTFAE